jgi:NOL1/NOP2/sun family putative RNA methylase
VKSNLEEFKESLKEIYKSRYPQILKALETQKPTTFRINLTKSTNRNIIKDLEQKGFKIKKGPIDNSYIIYHFPAKTYISDTTSFKEGFIYVQELSSMLPPTILAPKPGEIIIDMAAAPGSKTTQLADFAQNKAYIIALEKHPLRIEILRHNVKLQGAEKVKIIPADGIKYDKKNPELENYFDKVLVDAPCSSEGSFYLKDPKTYSFWKIKKRREMSSIQKGLLISGYRMLKPKGSMVYSTCTFGVEENELVLEWFLERYPEAIIKEITLPVNNTMNGIISWNNKSLNKKISKSKRILPNELFTGFFLALIEKP